MRRFSCLLLVLSACAHAPQTGNAGESARPTTATGAPAATTTTGTPAATTTSFPVETIAPRAEDVSSIDGMVRAYYEVVDVAPDAPRQWARDRTLFSPWIRFVAIGDRIRVMDHQQLVDNSEPLVRKGLHEREIFRTVRRYGDIAHVDSTYELRVGPEGKLSRGVNSLELYFDGKRWWITSAIWQAETPQHPIPPELLPRAR
ncbi:hypothetical protein [Pendulispora albinea]|uniref:Nuclear transport factor 2 family protein n=1 Tax=Pendulispora albinea TaxID=2741071 RepID=A0ABZ2M6Q7_9BACT